MIDASGIKISFVGFRLFDRTRDLGSYRICAKPLSDVHTDVSSLVGGLILWRRCIHPYIVYAIKKGSCKFVHLYSPKQ